MERPNQHSIATVVHARGTTGAGEVTLSLRPAPPGSGLTLVRLDLPGRPEIPCVLEEAEWDARGLRVGRGEWAVSGLVPLLAACQALGVDNARIELDGPAAPALDGGSAAPYVFLLRCAGRVDQGRPAAVLRLREVLCFTHDTGRLSSGGGEGVYLSVARAPRHSLGLALSEEVFVTQLARARATAAGRPRWGDEALRYAILEALAVIALCGARFRGRLHWVGGDGRLHLAFWRHWLALEDPPRACLGSG